MTTRSIEMNVLTFHLNSHAYDAVHNVSEVLQRSPQFKNTISCFQVTPEVQTTYHVFTVFDQKDEPFVRHRTVPCTHKVTIEVTDKNLDKVIEGFHKHGKALMNIHRVDDHRHFVYQHTRRTLHFIKPSSE